jgi:hypothetical protein
MKALGRSRAVDEEISVNVIDFFDSSMLKICGFRVIPSRSDDFA